jgi:hypothetical protein
VALKRALNSPTRAIASGVHTKNRNIMKNKFIFGMISSIVLLSGCVSAQRYKNISSG